MTDNFKRECNEYAYKNRLGKVVIGDKTITNATTLSNIEYNSSCINNGTIIGNVSNDTLKFNTIEDNEFVNKELNAFVGVKYSEGEPEYYELGKFIVSNENIENTSKNGEYNCVDYGSKLDKVYESHLANEQTATISEFYIDVCTQCGLIPKNVIFTNSNLVVGGNPFKGGESCRQVLSNIAQVSCSFVKIEKNVVDLVWFDNTISETFTKNDYSTLTKNQVYGPVNCLVIQDTYTEGENVTVQDEQSIAEHGETIITINDCYFLYTEELRNQAKTAIWNKIRGFTYIDFSLETNKGKPYLKKGNKISIQENDESYFQTYILNHQFIYDGTFKSVISANSLTKVEVEAKNVQESTSVKFRRVERKVDKVNGVISDFVEDFQDIKYIEETPTSSTTNITNALNKNAISNVVYGNSYQETRSGKNLINLTALELNRENLDISSYTSNTLNFSSRSSIGNYARIYFQTSTFINSGVTYTISLKVKSNVASSFFVSYMGSGHSKQIQLTANTTTNFAMAFTNPSAYLSIGTYTPNATFEVTDIQIEAGSSQTSFEPYGAKPSPDYPSEIDNVGVENLYIPITTANGTNITRNNVSSMSVASDGTITMVASGTDMFFSNVAGNGATYNEAYYGYLMAVKPNTTYRLHCTNNQFNKTYVSEYTSSKISTGYTGLATYSKDFTTKSDTAYITIRFGVGNSVSGTTYSTKVMISEGAGQKIFIPKTDYIDYSKITLYNTSTATPIQNGWRITKGNSVNVGLNLSAIAENLPVGTYTLSYKVKKVSGKLVSIGGHTIYGFKSFYIDGKIQDTDYYEPALVEDDTKEHYITYTFDTNMARAISALYIQPNRSYEDNMVYDVYDIHLTSGDEKNIHFGKWVIENIEGTKELDVSDSQDNTFINVNGTTLTPATNNNYWVTGFNEVKPNAKYRTSIMANVVYFFDENNNFLRYEGDKTSFTTTENDKYVRLCFSKRNVAFKGNINYYETSIYKTSLNGYELNKIGDVKDEIDLVSGVLTRRIGKVVLNGSENFVKSNAAFQYQNVVFPSNIGDITNAVSNNYKFKYYPSGITSNIQNYEFGWNANKYLTIRDDRFSTANDFKTWLSNNNVVVYYILATPETTQLEKHDIELYENINNISFESNVDPTYKIDYYYGVEKEGTEALKSSTQMTSKGIIQQVSRGDIISTINQSAEEVKINADKISLEGKEINLTSDDIEINSNKFKVDKNGILTCTDANCTNMNINGGNITIDTNNWSGIKLMSGPNNEYIWEMNGLNITGKDGDNNNILMNSYTGSIVCQRLNTPGKIEIGLNGSLNCLGEKNRVVEIEDGTFRKMSAYETATPYFGDIGSNKTNDNGECKIEIENIFSQTIEKENYKVFIQECGNGKLWVEKYDSYFIVKGTPNIEFDWEIKSIQKGYKNNRLEEYKKDDKENN